MHTLSRRQAAQRGLGLLLGLGALPLGGCPRLPGDVPSVKPGDYGDSPAELVRLWQAVLGASQRDEREETEDHGPPSVPVRARATSWT